jgi:hypothetical protein
MFWRWRRLGEGDRPRVWELYGWFSGLMCAGSVFGAVAWAAWMQALVTDFTGYYGLSPAQRQSFFSQSQYWSAAFYVTYGIEFLCLSVAKLLVLHRMQKYAVANDVGLSRSLAVRGRVVMAAVVVGNVVGLCGNVAAAVLFKQVGNLSNAAAAAFAANSTQAANAIVVQAFQKNNVASGAASVQQFCEVAVLLIIIVAFAVVGITNARLVSSALRGMNDAWAALKQIRRQIVGTTAIVFVTFLLRAVFSTMNALANVLQTDGAACPTPCGIPCNNLWTLIQYWLQFTPEFQVTVVLISSPLALLVALWGMTSELTLELMKRSSGGQSAMHDKLLQG